MTICRHPGSKEMSLEITTVIKGCANWPVAEIKQEPFIILVNKRKKYGRDGSRILRGVGNFAR